MKYLKYTSDQIYFELKENIFPLKSSIKIQNVSEIKVLFKIKTTDVYNFSVKPHKGIINPSDEVEIYFQIINPITKQEAELLIENQFQFQSMQTSNLKSPDDFEKIWKSTDQNKIGQLRLKVNIYQTVNNIKEYILSSKSEYNSFYQQVRQSNSLQNNLGALDQDNLLRTKISQLSVKYDELEKNIKAAKAQREISYNQMIKNKAMNSQHHQESNKSKYIFIAIGLVLSFLILK